MSLASQKFSQSALAIPLSPVPTLNFGIQVRDAHYNASPGLLQVSGSYSCASSYVRRLTARDGVKQGRITLGNYYSILGFRVWGFGCIGVMEKKMESMEYWGLGAHL